MIFFLIAGVAAALGLYIAVAMLICRSILEFFDSTLGFVLFVPAAATLFLGLPLAALVWAVVR